MVPRTPFSRAVSRLVRRFRRSSKGATAVEFALVAMPFFALMFAILETALAFWSTQVLETAVANAARQIYTGQFQTDSSNASLTAAQLTAKFKTLVCDNAKAVFDCNGLISVDVRTFSDFSSASAPVPVTNGRYDTSSYGYQTPGRSQITLVRASMEYPSYTRFLSGTTGLANGNRLIMASAAFRTEPY